LRVPERSRKEADMSGRRALSATLAAALLSALALPASSADAGGGDVVVRVGASALGAAQVTRRLQALAPFQLVTFGDSAPAIRRHFVERVLAPELAAEEEAKRLRLRERPELRDTLQYELVQALGDALREELTAQGVASDAAVRDYYERHRAQYESSERIRIWRIVVRDEATARNILTLAAGEKGVKKWTELARDQSEDKATHLRDGDLGFVRADGSTDVPELRVDPALFAAAAKLRDGELVPEPLREGERWAVVWRRGTLPATKRTLEEEAGAIRQLLLRTKLQDAVERLAADLRKRHVQAVTYEPLDNVAQQAFGDVAARTLPSALPRHPARAQPVKGDRGYR
jgi:peptidyl-prolyl cis-trans isomerase C